MADRLRPVTAPEGDLDAVLADDGAAGLSLLVRHRQREVLRMGPVGIILTGTAPPGAVPVVAGRTDRVVDESYTTPTGKRLAHRHHAAEATFTLAVGEHEVELDVRVARDGVAYRHRLAAPDGPADAVTITGEPAVFTPAHGGGDDGDRLGEARVWLAPYRDNYEGLWRGGLPLRDLAGGGSYGFPVLVGWGDDLWCLLTEAAVDGSYAASRMTWSPPGVTGFRLTLPQESVLSSLPLTTPWRVAVVGDLAAVVESDLVTDLNPPSRVDDTSWIRPGRVAWSWWAEKFSPTDPERQRAHVDYAAKHGWEFVLVDARWDPSWLPELVRYASGLGVGVLIWSHWTGLETQEQRDELLPRWRDWGIAGIKVDFMDSDTQERMAWYEALARDAAEHRLMVNFHGSTVPKGRGRTWPHVMTYEAVLGAEHYVRRAERDGGYLVMPDHGPDSEHNTVVPFTRNVVGPMDYTPVTWSHERRTTSLAHELALSVVFESGWQHFADSIETYAGEPLAEAFLDLVPTVWDETRLVTGFPGRLVVIARRTGARWFVGGIASGPPRRVRFGLDVLGAGQRYDARLLVDGAGGRPAERSLQLATGDEVAVDLAADGGFVAELVPTTPAE
ncbi:glycoside hydrolase family 97 protein [Jiangella asiatica]|uniref:glycoside hydrolase family 97 protein n=1 Tax=Jiangella asiatica TaxID=2530372 RepID=UPI0013A5D4F7|nr:glycoside hydrolase family 97 protein [Jiangella asiatica]